MTISPQSLELRSRVQDFLDVSQRGELTAVQLAEFEQFLEITPEARHVYAEYITMLVCLPHALSGVVSDAATPLDSTSSGTSELPQPPSPAPTLFAAFHGTVGHLVSGWPMAYLVATVVLGIGLAIASRTYVSPSNGHNQSVASSSDSNPQSPIPHPSPVVGRITGMVDCVFERRGARGQGPGARGQWPVASGRRSENSESMTPDSALPTTHFSSHQPLATGHFVSLSDTFALRSGLLEITYDSGAKVILQGPVRYEVESAVGGYLAVGKLTARLGERGERRGESGESVASGHSPNPQSLIPNPSLSPVPSPLFSVRTPTAVVTDLGTEFGVEVDRQGVTRSHVFQGAVEVRTTPTAKETMPMRRVLHADESVRIGSQGDSGGGIRSVRMDSRRFVRQLPHTSAAVAKTLPMRVLSWFRMGEDDSEAVAGRLVAARTINGSHPGRYDLQRFGTPHYASATAAPRSSLAMHFTAANKDRFVAPHWGIIPNDDFILEAWVRVKTIVSEYEIVVHNGDTRHNGYGLLIKDAKWHFMFGDIRIVDSQVECKPGRWTHLALVCDRGTAALWVDGRPTKAIWHGIPTLPDGVFQLGCSSKLDEPMFFDGEIDEVRLSALRGPFQPEMLLLPQTMLFDNF